MKIKPIDSHTRQAFVSSNGALCAYSGKYTERMDKNSRLVKNAIT
jgi:ATP-dependent phosphoenolpyruvate carboxykinase